jgi:hypothetical protein
MTPETIIHKAQADGVMLTLSLSGTIKARGDGVAVNRWLTVVREHKAEIIASLETSQGGTAITSYRWLIHYQNREPVEVACTPPTTHAQMLEWYPGAVAAEPFTPTIRQPPAPLANREELAIRTWLALIGETDLTVIAEVIERCQRDADARDYFIGLAMDMHTSEREGMSQGP